MINIVISNKKIKSIFIFFFCILFLNLSNCRAAESTKEDLQIYCNSSLLMDFDSSNVLFEKNGYAKVYPASTTKILTSILVLENMDLNEKVVASKKAVDSIPIGSSIMGIKEEEVYSVENLLYGLMLPSGNDAAIVLAEAVSGNIDEFAKLMNNKAKEIGCLNTHFVNPHGFYDPNHYTTAYDMALILKYAMKYDKFRQIVETLEWELPATNKSETPRTLKNTNRLIDKDYSIFYDYALGGKTGYTIESRGTFVGYSKKDDKLVIVSNFDGSQNINGQNARFLDTITLSEYAFNNFSKEKIITKENFKYILKDENQRKKNEVTLKDDVITLVKNNSNIIIIPKLTLNNAISDTLDYNLNLSIKGDSLSIHDDFETETSNSNSYITKRNTKKYYTYIVLIILILIFVILIKKRYNLKKHDSDRSNFKPNGTDTKSVKTKRTRTRNININRK